jgi:arsenate reductase
MTIVYGIKNCDTMKKAFTWLDDHGVRYDFHDYKKEGIDLAQLKAWSKQSGWEALLNRAGTTWRKLSPAQQADMAQSKAFELMVENPSLIKRPILEEGSTVLVGFSADRYASLFNYPVGR